MGEHINHLFNDKWFLIFFVTLLSFIFSFLIYKFQFLQNKIFSLNLESQLRKVWIGVVIYTIFFTIVSIGQHYAINTLSHDLGLFDQLIWNVLQGRIGQTSLSNGSIFKEHLVLIIIPLSSFFLIFNGPEILLFLQSIFFALPAIPLYLISVKKFKSPIAGFAFAISYLFCSFNHNANLWNFTPFVFIIFFVIFGFYLILDTKKLKQLLGVICFIIAFSCREDVSLYVLPLSVLIFFREKEKKVGAVLFVVSIAWFIVSNKIIMPGLNPLNERYNIIALKYGWLGDSITSVILTAITHPLKVIKYIFTIDKVQIILRLFLPLAFLNLFDIWSVGLIVLPLCANLLSTMGHQRTMQFQYPIHIIPFVYIGAIYGAETVSRKWKLYGKFSNSIWSFIIIISILSSFAFASTVYNFRRCKMNDHKKMFFPLVKPKIPDKTSLSVQANLLPHFSHREIVHRFPQIDNVEYVLIDINSNKWPCSDEEYEKNVVLLKTNPNYKLIFEKDGYMIFKELKCK